MPIPDLLAGVFGQLPEELRTQVVGALDAPEAAPVVAELVNGYKRQSDYSRDMDLSRQATERANALYESNKRWYEANAAALAATKGTPAQTPGTPAPTPQPTTHAQSFTLDEVKALVAAQIDTFGADALGVVATTNDLSFRHFQEFGERLSIPELIAEASTRKCSLSQAYDAKFADRYAEKARKADEDRIAAIRAEAEAKVRAEYAQHPYPVRAGSGVDTLSGLNNPGNANDFSVTAAAAEYAQYEAKRALAG